MPTSQPTELTYHTMAWGFESDVCFQGTGLLQPLISRIEGEDFMNEAPRSGMKQAHDRRPPRLPLFVQVVTRPAIPECWSVDISSTGIGLIAGRLDDEGFPGEGREIEIALTLPDSGARIEARAEVRWRHDAPGSGREAGVALGLHFTWMSGAHRTILARYLHDYRFHVAVVFADAGDRDLVTSALADDLRLHFTDEATSLGEIMERGDIAAVVVCGDDARQLEAVIDEAHGRFARAPWPGLAIPRDLAPRLVHLGRVPPPVLVEKFNDGGLFRALAPPVDEVAVRHEVLQACGDYGMRTEQRRLAQALERGLVQERAGRRPELRPLGGAPAWMVHHSPAMERTMEMVRRVAPHRMGVLLQGETGTGKELLAQALHELSDRADGPFIIQDCGALPESLLESELFGHVRGAFTGATSDHPGLFVLADGGTIFLDEIENTSPNLQARLLRVLETGTVRPVGGTEFRHVDVRVVTASNRNLREEVAGDRFRQDLFYRLGNFIIDVPPLRARGDDVIALANYFLDEANADLGCSATGFTDAAAAMLRAYRWPGNVRELKNVVGRAVLLSTPGEAIGPALLPAEVHGPTAADGPPTLRTRVTQTERTAIQEALARHQGVVRRAAAELGVSPVTLGRKIRQLGIPH